MHMANRAPRGLRCSGIASQNSWRCCDNCDYTLVADEVGDIDTTILLSPDSCGYHLIVVAITGPITIEEMNEAPIVNTLASYILRRMGA